MSARLTVQLTARAINLLGQHASCPGNTATHHVYPMTIPALHRVTSLLLVTTKPHRQLLVTGAIQKIVEETWDSDRCWDEGLWWWWQPQQMYPVHLSWCHQLTQVLARVRSRQEFITVIAHMKVSNNNKPASLDVTSSKYISPLEKCIWPCCNLDLLWPLTLKTFSAVSTQMMNICDKFHWNPSTEYRDITSHEICVNGRTGDWKM